VLTGALIVVGCGGSSQVSSSVGSYIGHASNAAVFIQWTRSGNSLSGSLQEAITKEAKAAEWTRVRVRSRAPSTVKG
jgi:ribosomal protein L14